MTENSIEAQYDVTKKSKFKKFYDSNKTVIFFFIFILILLFGSLSFYFEKKEGKKILLSEKYVEAQFYIDSGNKNEALGLLKKIIYENDPTYSTLSFFLILNANLINDYKETLNLYDYLLDNNKFDKELRNLLIYKKALFNSNYANEAELLENIKPILNTDTLWKPHALILLGDYFMSKGETIKAAEFYQKVLSTNNLSGSLYEQTKTKVISIANE